MMLLLFFALISCNKEKAEQDKTLKKELQFEDWPGKNSNIREGINLSKLKIVELNDALEKKPKNLFFISRTQNDTPFIQYRSKWQQSDSAFIEITISYLNSSIEAQDYLIDYYILGSSLPPEILKKSRDKPALVGDISFYNGQIFIRNNIVIKIHAEGQLQNRVLKIAKKVDSLLLNQETFKTNDFSKPRLEKDNNGNFVIIEP